MEVKLRKLEVCFIAKSKIFDGRGIQIGTFSHFNHTKIHIFFLDLCRHATFYIAGFAILSSPVVILRDLKVCFIATLKLYDWRGIQIDMFVDI